MPARVLAFVFVLLVVPALPAPAQSTMGSVIGTVMDQEGAPLPGVSVVLRSPNLQGERVAITGADGGFRLVNLSPGRYVAVFALPGYQRVDLAGVQVNIGTAVRIDATLPPAFGEEVVVTSESPLVNTTTTTLGLSLTADLFLDLPVDRNYTSIASIAPGAQDDRSGQTFYGSTGAENAYFIDGVNTTEIERGQQGKVLNFEFIQEVQVKTGGYRAEHGHSTGGVINVITKAGGNEFHGDVFGYYDSDSLRSPLAGEAEQGQVSGTSKKVGIVRSDYGADLGGYVFRDTLWFFAAYDRVENRDTNEALDDYGAVVPGAPMAGERFPWDTTRDLFALKLTGRLSGNHSLSASVFGDPTVEEGAWPRFDAPPTYYLARDLTGGTDGALTYDGVLGENVVLSARYAAHNERYQTEGPGAGLTGYVDYTDPFGNGTYPRGWEGVESGWGNYEEEDFGRQQFNADLSWFVDDLVGHHELKVGAEYEDLSVVNISIRSGPVGANVLRFMCNPARHYCGDNSEHEYYYLHSYGTYELIDPQLATPEDIAKRRAVDTPSENIGVYLQDRWQPTSNLSVDLGVRWSRQKLYNGAGTVQADIDDNWAPRLGFVWDFLGNGRSKLFGHWGRFYETIPMDIVIKSFGGSSPWVYAFNFSDDEWAIQQPPPGEAPRDARTWDWGGFDRVDPNIKGQYLSEAVLGAELEVASDVVVGLRLIRRDLDRVIEDALSEDGGYYIGNPSEGLMAHTYTIAAAYGYTCPDGTLDCHRKAIPPPKRQFTGVEASVQKRFSNSFQLIASVLWSRLEGNYDGNFQASTLQLDPNLNSAYDYADFSVNNDGELSNDRPWQLKLDGVYRWDFGLTVGLSASYRSGTPMTAMGYCFAYNNWEYYLSERGAFGRTDAEYEADLHLGYPIRLGRGVELNLLVDIFNAFNRQGETGRYTRYTFFEDYQPLDWATGEAYPPIVPGDPDRPPTSPAWNTTRWWQDPRTIRLGLRMSF